LESGGGTAGVPLGARYVHDLMGRLALLLTPCRLAENPNLNVGIIEAGSFHKDDPIVDIPGKERNNTSASVVQASSQDSLAKAMAMLRTIGTFLVPIK
jgi:hypothetical protein